MLDTPGSTTPQLFTITSAASLGAVAALGIVAYFGSKTLLTKSAKWQDRFTFIWIAFDAMIHFSFEGQIMQLLLVGHGVLIICSFLYLSMFGRQVNTSVGPFAEMWKEYARADYRWGYSDETVVSLEILTVLGAGPICCYILRQLIKDDPARHYWIVILSTAELYGGWMTFCPEWLSGSPNLDTSNPLYLWVYLFFMNIIWVGIPLWLMYDSYGHIVGSLRLAQASARAKRN